MNTTSSSFSAFGSSAFGSKSNLNQNQRAGFSESAAKAFGSSSNSYNAERAGAFASGAFSSRPTAPSRSMGSASSDSFSPKIPKAEPPPVASSFTDFPSLKKTVAAPVATAKPVMNFKAVAAAAASKPAPPPPSVKVAASGGAGSSSYYDYEEEEEDVDLEITDEDGGLNVRRAGDKSNW